MSSIRPIDLRFIDSLVDIGFGAGYVLDFSNATFAEFFEKELSVDICDPKYEGGSKGKRLRKFFELANRSMQVTALDLLWEYRSAALQQRKQEEPLQKAYERLVELRNRLNVDTADSSHLGTRPKPTYDQSLAARLRTELQQLWQLAPQSRGYAFERFLKQLFDIFRLEGRDAFRLVGEQIDGSFLLSGETYLLEAKWTADLVGVDHLHNFQGKLGEKASWARGLIISYNGFTEGGLAAFGRGKKVICMDGLDLDDALRRQLRLDEVLNSKVRRAAETGIPFIRVRDLFPE